MPKHRIGGSFAPPLPDGKLDRYETLANADSTDPQVADYMRRLIKMLRVFRETPDSERPGTPHPSGVGTIIPLEDAECRRICDVVPWKDECDLMGQVFDRIPNDTQKELRDAAFHLLWFARELCADREPITNDKLGM